MNQRMLRFQSHWSLLALVSLIALLFVLVQPGMSATEGESPTSITSGAVRGELRTPEDMLAAEASLAPAALSRDTVEADNAPRCV